MDWKFKDGDEVSFYTIDSKYGALNGCHGTIVRKVTEEEADLCEVGPMYVISFEIHAFEDELDGSLCGLPVNR